MFNRNLKCRMGSGYIVLMVVVAVMIILTVIYVPKYISSLTEYKVPVSNGDYLIYKFSRGSGADFEEGDIEFEFVDKFNGTFTATITDIKTGTEKYSDFNSLLKFKDSAKELYFKGVAPVYYPKNRLAKGGSIRGHRILEHKEWKGWDVWVAGEPKLSAMYYERSTGFLVGFEFITPEVTSATLIGSNIKGL